MNDLFNARDGIPWGLAGMFFLLLTYICSKLSALVSELKEANTWLYQIRQLIAASMEDSPMLREINTNKGGYFAGDILGELKEINANLRAMNDR